MQNQCKPWVVFLQLNIPNLGVMSDCDILSVTSRCAVQCLIGHGPVLWVTHVLESGTDVAWKSGPGCPVKKLLRHSKDFEHLPIVLRKPLKLHKQKWSITEFEFYNIYSAGGI